MMRNILVGSHMDKNLICSVEQAQAHCLFLAVRLRGELNLDSDCDVEEDIDLCEWWSLNCYETPEYGSEEFEKLYAEMEFPKWDEPGIERVDYATSGAYEIGWRVYLPQAFEDLKRINLRHAYLDIEDYFSEIYNTKFFGWEGYAMIAHATYKAFSKYGINKRFWLEEAIESYNEMHVTNPYMQLNKDSINQLRELFAQAQQEEKYDSRWEYIRQLFNGEMNLENLQ